ncbi:MAG: hypothetical protein C0605_08680 [Hyphomicrobiales bacterium]|nr:MAG: hypothetical protein C0605_08680 [Hyphomicrobiales bacterium]
MTGEKQTATALQYDGKGAPTVTARGEGELARRIIAAAEEAGVPIEENPLLSEALAGVELGAEIPVELYQAVAEVISFILGVSRK